jgi:pilus assembly protein Flp/PilA
MKSKFWNFLSKVRALRQVDGQDLVEYALVVALIAFAATSGMKTLAGDINSAFNRVGSELTSDVL